MSERRVSGALLWRHAPQGGVEVLLVHRIKHDDWALPKGGAEAWESDEQCAIREVEEETGFRCELDWELPGTAYFDGRHVRRTVRYWAGRATSGTFVANSEVDKIQWLAPADALRVVTEPRERPMIVALTYALARGNVGAGERPRRVILLRRAAVLPREQWDGSDDLRPLRVEGVREADALRALAVLFDIDVVLSSPARRCIQTVEPLALALHRPVRVMHDLVDRDPRAALDVVRGVQADGALLCTHESVIAGILAGLVAEDGLVLHDRIRRRRASAWCLQFENDRCVSAMYIPSPETLVPDDQLVVAS